jgi:hypothetical protein
VLHDWQKRYVCGQLKWDDILEYFRYFVPGQHRLAVTRQIPKGAPELAEADFYPRIVAEFASLVPVYRLILWTTDNNHLGMKNPSP